VAYFHGLLLWDDAFYSEDINEDADIWWYKYKNAESPFAAICDNYPILLFVSWVIVEHLECLPLSL
jgi:hypothetical protein